MTPSSVNQAIQINKTGLRNASATNSMGGKELGKQDFLNLLMTQMANQDPLDPMKSENMMQQLAAMGTVEQLQNLNNQTAQLMALQQDISRASTAVSYYEFRTRCFQLVPMHLWRFLPGQITPAPPL